MRELLVKDILPDLEKAVDVKAKVEEVRTTHRQTTQSIAWKLEPGVMWSIATSSTMIVSQQQQWQLQASMQQSEFLRQQQLQQNQGFFGGLGSIFGSR